MNGMKEAYTARELSPILGLTERAVLYLAEREGWQSRPRAGRGGGREWLVDSMPEDTRLAIAAKVALFTPVPVKAPAPVTLSLPSRFAGNGKTRAEAKAALFFLYRMFTKTAGASEDAWHGNLFGSLECRRDRVRGMASGSDPARQQKYPAQLGACDQDGRHGAARGDYGKGKRGKGCIDGQPEVKALIVAAVCEHPGKGRRATCGTSSST